MLQFYHEQKGDMVLWNPVMVGILTTICLVTGLRAYMAEYFDSLLLLQFSFSLLTFWRCLTIKQNTSLGDLPKNTLLTIEMEGKVPLCITLALCLLHGILIFIGYDSKVSLDNTNFFKRMSSIFILSGSAEKIRISHIIWWSIDLVLLAILAYVKSTYKLTFNQQEFGQLRKIYKKLNLVFKVVSYGFLAYSSLSNPVYIFIVYLALKQQIGTSNKHGWSNTSNLIGLMRYLTLASFILTALHAPCIYLVVGGQSYKSFFENNELPKASIISLVFFLASHLCVYTHQLCILLPRVEYAPIRNSFYPSEKEFEESYFHKYLLTKWMRIMDSSHFALLSQNYFNHNIKLLQAGFKKDKLIELHIERLMLKQDTNSYRWVSRLLVRVGLSDKGTQNRTFDDGQQLRPDFHVYGIWSSHCDSHPKLWHPYHGPF